MRFESSTTYLLCSEFANISGLYVQITVTQKGIKHVLRERWYAWEEASRLYAKGVYPSMEEDVMEPEEDKVEEDKVEEDTVEEVETLRG